MSLLSELNELRCSSRWDDVANLASGKLEDPTMALASVEAKVIAAELTGRDAKPLLGEIPRSTNTHEDNFISAALKAQIYLLLDSPKRALSALDDTFEVPPTSPYIGATVVKSRALLGQAYARTGDYVKAIEAMKSVNVSEPTLETNHEAAVWAARLYAQIYALEPLQIYKDAYENSVRLGKLERDNRVPALSGPALTPVNSHPPTSSQQSPAPTSGSIATFAPDRSIDTGNGTVIRHDRAAAGTTDGAAATIGSQAKSSHNHHSNGNQVSALQQKLAKQQVIEADAEKTADNWRTTTATQLPVRLVVADHQRSQTRNLLSKVWTWIEQTFDSPVLMRINVELLIALGEYVEAFAAFDTYVSYQKLQLLKQQSGAHANSDDEIRCMDIYAKMLPAIALGPIAQSVPRFDRIAAFLQSIEGTMPSKNEVAIGIYHGICAKVHVWQALNSVGNDNLNDRITLAQKHFDSCFESPWEGDAATHYLQALIHIQSKPAAEVFTHVKGALTKFPDFVPLWHFLILLLTAENQYADAQQITEQVLDDNMGTDFSKMSTVAKRYFMELKMTHVAIIEARHGIAAALEELGGTLELVSALYPHNEVAKSHKQISQVQERVYNLHKEKKHSHNHRLKILRGHSTHRKFKTPAVSNSQTGRVKNPDESLDSDCLSHLVEIWLWVSQVYMRADLLEEAHAAINEAETLGLGPTAETIAAKAQTLVATEPALAWKKFRQALALDYDNMSAVIGHANLLDIHGRVSSGIVDDSRPSVLFQTSGDELEATRSSLSALENLVNHNPGRFTPEAWCMYGITLANLGDTQEAKQALWKSVQLDEKSGVRAYTPNLAYV